MSQLSGFCNLTFVDNCQYIEYTEIANISHYENATDYFNGEYCCNYLLGTDESMLSQQKLFDNITSVRDLNRFVLWSDITFVAVALLVFSSAKIKNFRKSKELCHIFYDIRKLYRYCINIRCGCQHRLKDFDMNLVMDIYNNAVVTQLC